VWADCEARERRHNLGRGTLVVLDAVSESCTLYIVRRALLQSLRRYDRIIRTGLLKSCLLTQPGIPLVRCR
jgi:hypothetical protein